MRAESDKLASVCLSSMIICKEITHICPPAATCYIGRASDEVLTMAVEWEAVGVSILEDQFPTPDPCVVNFDNG